MDERRPITPIGPAVDPWPDAPVLYVSNYERYRGGGYAFINKQDEVIVVPVVPGRAAVPPRWHAFVRNGR